jgi:hypothetical protein
LGLEWLTPKRKHLDNGVTGCNETMQVLTTVLVALLKTKLQGVFNETYNSIDGVSRRAFWTDRFWPG